MRPRARIDFDLKKTFVVRKAFTANGHPMGIGQDFPWRQLAVNTRRMTQLWDHRFIDHPDIPALVSEPEPELIGAPEVKLEKPVKKSAEKKEVK